MFNEFCFFFFVFFVLLFLFIYCLFVSFCLLCFVFVCSGHIQRNKLNHRAREHLGSKNKGESISQQERSQDIKKNKDYKSVFCCRHILTILKVGSLRQAKKNRRWWFVLQNNTFWMIVVVRLCLCDFFFTLPRFSFLLCFCFYTSKPPTVHHQLNQNQTTLYTLPNYNHLVILLFLSYFNS